MPSVGATPWRDMPSVGATPWRDMPSVGATPGRDMPSVGCTHGRTCPALARSNGHSAAMSIAGRARRTCPRPGAPPPGHALARCSRMDMPSAHREHRACPSRLANGDADPVAPRILEAQFGPGVVGLDAGRLEPVGQGSDVVARGHFDQHLAEAQRVAARPGAAAVPDVHRHVVVVAAGGDEERLTMPAGGLLEAERADVEVM